MNGHNLRTLSHSTHAQAHHPSIHPSNPASIQAGNRQSERPLLPSKRTIRVQQHAARTKDKTGVLGAALQRPNAPNIFFFFLAQTCQKEKNLSLPSRSHNCMASKLRSLIIPSQGLNGLVRLCAKPGTSISAERSGWCVLWLRWIDLVHGARRDS